MSVTAGNTNVVKFNYIGQESLTIWKEIITGVEWQKLSEENRGEYILESVIDAQRDCLDGSYGTIDISLARLN